MSPDIIILLLGLVALMALGIPHLLCHDERGFQSSCWCSTALAC